MNNESVDGKTDNINEDLDLSSEFAIKNIHCINKMDIEEEIFSPPADKINFDNFEEKEFSDISSIDNVADQPDVANFNKENLIDHIHHDNLNFNKDNINVELDLSPNAKKRRTKEDLNTTPLPYWECIYCANEIVVFQHMIREGLSEKYLYGSSPHDLNKISTVLSNSRNSMVQFNCNISYNYETQHLLNFIIMHTEYLNGFYGIEKSKDFFKNKIKTYDAAESSYNKPQPNTRFKLFCFDNTNLNTLTLFRTSNKIKNISNELKFNFNSKIYVEASPMYMSNYNSNSINFQKSETTFEMTSKNKNMSQDTLNYIRKGEVNDIRIQPIHEIEKSTPGNSDEGDIDDENRNTFANNDGSFLNFLKFDLRRKIKKEDISWESEEHDIWEPKFSDKEEVGPEDKQVIISFRQINQNVNENINNSNNYINKSEEINEKYDLNQSSDYNLKKKLLKNNSYNTIKILKSGNKNNLSGVLSPLNKLLNNLNNKSIIRNKADSNGLTNSYNNIFKNRYINKNLENPKKPATQKINKLLCKSNLKSSPEKKILFSNLHKQSFDSLSNRLQSPGNKMNKLAGLSVSHLDDKQPSNKDSNYRGIKCEYQLRKLKALKSADNSSTNTNKNSSINLVSFPGSHNSYASPKNSSNLFSFTQSTNHVSSNNISSKFINSNSKLKINNKNFEQSDANNNTSDKLAEITNELNHIDLSSSKRNSLLTKINKLKSKHNAKILLSRSGEGFFNKTKQVESTTSHKLKELIQIHTGSKLYL